MRLTAKQAEQLAALTREGGPTGERAWTVLHLFSGIGGCTLGFKRAGFRSVGSIDFDAKACAQLERMTGTPAFCRDLATMQPGELRELVPASPDVLVMSPPCKSFSGCMPAARAAEEHYVDMSQLAVRGTFLALEAWEQGPGLILIENVPRIQTRGAPLLAQIVKLLHRYGYATDSRVHDCGKIGGLAQHRDRFLLMARHMARVPSFLRKPPEKRVRNVGEVLLPLPSPVAAHGDPMHRLPLLSPLNWLRLALIPPGKDWRALPPEVRIGGPDLPSNRHAGKLGVEDDGEPAHTVVGRGNRPGSGWSSVADPRVGFGGPNTHSGILGVEDPDQPAHTVTGNARVQASHGAVADPRIGEDGDREPRAGSYGVQDPGQPADTVRGRHDVWTAPASVADPRVAWSSAKHGGRPDSFGVASMDEPSLVVRGRQEVQTSRASVADPRLAESATRFKGKLQVSSTDAHSNTITGSSAQPALGACAVVADPRLGCEQRSGSYGVQGADQPAATVVGHHSHDNSPGSLADPRLAHTPRRGTLGVVGLDQPSPTIRGHHDPRSAPAAVVDDRGWPVPTHELVFEAGVWTLYGPTIDLESKRPCLMVIKVRGKWHRPFTNRELFALQAGPLDFVLEGPSSSSKTQAGVREWIGNMIPADAAEAMGLETIICLESSTVAGFLRGADVWVERAGLGMQADAA